VRAVVVNSFDGPSGLRIQELPEPVPSGEQVLIDVDFAGVCFPDLLQTRGEYQVRPQLPFTLGWEVAGVVRVPGGQFHVGDRVCAMPVVGGFAETVAVDPSMVFALPDGMPLEKAAGLPLNALTAHFALVRRAQLKAGEVVLVHGAAGGVGSAACQLASALGARVIAVVSTQEKAQLATRAGAHEVISVQGFRQDARRLTAGRGVDVVVDPVGGDRFVDSLRSLAPEGRLLVLGFTAGDVPTVKVNRLLLGNTSVLGVGVVELWRHEPGFAAAQWRELTGFLESGVLDPIVGSIFALHDAAQALHQIEERRSIGKVLLRVR
jgi:NADPH2:quinone reductase